MSFKFVVFVKKNWTRKRKEKILDLGIRADELPRLSSGHEEIRLRETARGGGVRRVREREAGKRDSIGASSARRFISINLICHAKGAQCVIRELTVEWAIARVSPLFSSDRRSHGAIRHRPRVYALLNII